MEFLWSIFLSFDMHFSQPFIEYAFKTRFLVYFSNISSICYRRSVEFVAYLVNYYCCKVMIGKKLMEGKKKKNVALQISGFFLHLLILLSFLNTHTTSQIDCIV